MAFIASQPDWLDLAGEPHPADPLIDPQRRLGWASRLFMAAALIVLGRVVQLEWSQGETFRHSAVQPIVRRQSVVGIRGRILARDGTILAVDEERPALAVHYRYLQSPPHPSWLRRQARARLTPSQRKNRELVARMESQICQQRRELESRLAQLCGLSNLEWQRRTVRIQRHVEQISRHVNQRLRAEYESRRPPAPTHSHHLDMWAWLVQEFDAWIWSAEGPTPSITVAEELDYHVVAEDLPLEIVAEIEGHPQDYPGVRIEPRRRRHYPHGESASNLLGHLGAVNRLAADGGGTSVSQYHPDDRVGLLGLERQHESLLRADRGETVQHVHRTGELVDSQRVREPGIGRDITLTLDLALQRTAEALLDDACRRRDALSEAMHAAGGALVVLDVRSGAVLAAASAPRFDPNLFTVAGHVAADQQVAQLLAHPAHPLFCRATRMALTPGSVFKPITAVALIEAARVDAASEIHCQGYLHRPDAQRCMIYTRQGIGHGRLNLVNALTRSCNVYFFQSAGAMGAEPLCEWATRFGLGRPTGIDLPGEAAGHVPDPQATPWKLADTQALAIGQSRLTVTPLQMARVMAALANGGRLVHPHLLNSVAGAETPRSDAAQTHQELLNVSPPQQIEGLRPNTLATIGEGLRGVVAEPSGTAHETAFLDEVSLAGKTGTAQAGLGLPDHAWFAAYCPIEAPKVALVVALEHAGDGGQAAAPVARQLVQRMHQLGYFRTSGAKRKTAPGT